MSESCKTSTITIEDGYKRLAVRMVLQAVRDLKSGSTINRQSAIYFLKSGFAQFVCLCVGIDEEKLAGLVARFSSNEQQKGARSNEAKEKVSTV